MLSVSVLEGRVVFLTCGMLCSWERAWKHQGSVGTTPAFLAAAFLGRNLPGFVGAGAGGAGTLLPHGMWVVQGG